MGQTAFVKNRALARACRRSRANGILVAISLGSWGPCCTEARARAAETPEAAVSPDKAQALTSAKELFKRGVALFEAGDVEHALDAFLQSRQAYASKPNTLNAAICLNKLGRYDEALELYEEAIASFGTSLDAAEQASVPETMAKLRGKVATLDVSANVGGALVVDGRARGTLPLANGIRVLPGSHLVRVIKDGFATFEKTVLLEVGRRSAVDARLEPLAASGGLRVESPSVTGGDAIVDGVVVGILPWEGTLAPGPHVVIGRKGTVGSPPTLATVLQGQTTLVRLKAGALGDPTRISVEPSTAAVKLNLVPLGHGGWEGPLPIGNYQVQATEEGYVPRRVAFVVGASDLGAGAGGGRQQIHIALTVDPSHPRWPKRPSGHLWLGVLAGYALGPSLGGSAEASCSKGCASHGIGGGAIVGIRTGYELPFKLSVEASFGYLAFGASVARSASETFPRTPPETTVTYDLRDAVRLGGPWLGAGVSQRIELSAHVALRPRVGVGVLFAHSRDAIAATAHTTSDQARAAVDGVATNVSSNPFFATGEMAVEMTLGRFRLGGALGAFLVPSGGPPLPTGDIAVPSAGCTAATPTAVGCAPGSAAVRGERAYGPFTLFVPQIEGAFVF